jgi:serpin B
MRTMRNGSGKRLGAAIPPMAVAALLGACGDSGTSTSSSADSTLPPAVASAKKTNAPVDGALVTADNALGLNLLRAIQQQSPTDNVTISPVSVAITLQILLNGAAGATQEAMTQVLQLGPLTSQQVNADNAALQAALTNPDPEVTLTIANSLWMHLASNPVLPAFQQVDTQYYGAKIGDLSGAPDDINAWVAQQTQGQIQDIAPAADYSQVVAFLANAVYFHGNWASAFDPAATRPGTFTAGDGSGVTVQMMHMSGSLQYRQGQGFQMLRLPYGQGRLSMLILLPDSSTSFDSFISNVTSDSIATWVSQLQAMPLGLALPRFNAQADTNLQAPLTTLGMGIAFDCQGDLVASADFSNLVSARSCIGIARHSASVQVDETGTTAAAATGVGVVTTSLPQQMSVDHPFLYAIRDDDNGALLFIGTMLNPSQ